MLWPRANAQGATAVFALGYALGLGRMLGEILCRLRPPPASWTVLRALLLSNYLYAGSGLFAACALTHVLVSLASPPPAQMQLHGLALLPGWPRRVLHRGCSCLARGRRARVAGVRARVVGGAAGGDASGDASGDAGGGARGGMGGGEGGGGTAAGAAVELGSVKMSAVEITRSRREAKGKLPMLGGGGSGGGGSSGGGSGGGSGNSGGDGGGSGDGGGGSGSSAGGGSCGGEPPDSAEVTQPPGGAAGVSGTRSGTLPARGAVRTRLAWPRAMAQQWGGGVSQSFPRMSAALAALLVAIVVALIAACF